MTTLAEDLVPDKLWADGRAPAAAAPRPWYGGRRRTVPDRSCFAAIVYMARTSTPWRLLPAQELGCGSPATAWRRLDRVGQRGRVRATPPAHAGPPRRAGRLDWSRASVDSASVRAKRGGPRWRKSSRSRQAGSKIQLVCEGSGLPLTAAVTAANLPDVTMLQAWSATSRRCAHRPAGGAAGPASWTRTRATTAPTTVPGCGGVGSGRGSLGVGSSRRSGSGAIAGGSNARCRG